MKNEILLLNPLLVFDLSTFPFIFFMDRKINVGKIGEIERET